MTATQSTATLGPSAADGSVEDGNRLEIDVVSDVVCPWCFIGKRQLDAALARWAAEQPPAASKPTVRWRAYQLNPDMPLEGIDRADYYRRKFGHPSPPMLDRVNAAARAVGLELAMDRITVQPNTLRAHALIELAGDGDCQSAMAEALFRAFFIEGRNLADDRTLRDIATGVGLLPDLIDAAIDGESVRQFVAAGEAELRDYGVNGVPLFIIGREETGRVAVSGAQGTDALLDVMRRSESGA
jgi:predicted DsbA family dithiol-disulfide isomerase